MWPVTVGNRTTRDRGDYAQIAVEDTQESMCERSRHPRRTQQRQWLVSLLKSDGQPTSRPCVVVLDRAQLRLVGGSLLYPGSSCEEHRSSFIAVGAFII